MQNRIQMKEETEQGSLLCPQGYKNSWGYDVLLNFLGSELYERQAKAITNFSKTLSAPQSDLAQKTTKDPYVFNFLAMTEEYNERELEDTLVANVTKFLVELGTGCSRHCP